MAQEVSATASVSETNVEPGDPVEYRIQVTGGQPERPPTAPEVEGLTITYIGESNQMQMRSTINGLQVSSTHTYTYNIDASRPGRYTIPGHEFRVGSTMVRIAPVALNITGSAAGAAGGGNAQFGGRQADQAAFVRLLVPKKTAYVGESVPVEIRVYLGARLRFQSDTNPVMSGEGFSAQKFSSPLQETETLDGAPFNIIRYTSSITGLKIGEISLGPTELVPIIQRPRAQQPRSRQRFPQFDDPFFNDPFGAFSGGSYIERREKLVAEAQKLDIRPLPAGAPDDFSGAIGRFKLEVEAQGNPRKIHAGDPVTLRATLRGEGNFDRIQAPSLADENGLQTYPASSKFSGDDDMHFRGTKTFEQVVIPRSARDSLPGYRFAYLDPNTGKYVSLETKPIALKVEGTAPTPAPTASQSVAADGAPSSAPTATPTPTPKPQDILYIRNDPGMAVDGEAFLPLFRRRIFWLAQLAPLGALLGLAALVWRSSRNRDVARHRAAERVRLQNELEHTLQAEKTGRREFYTAATRLAQLKVASSANGQADSLSAEEVARAKHLDPDTASSLEEIFHRYDELSYSGERAAQEIVPVHERRDVLATVGKL